MSEISEKLILKRVNPITEEKYLVSTHQCGFRKNHSTIDQVHHLTDITEKAFEDKGLCSAIFFDIAQAFDRVWHRGLVHKLRTILSDHFHRLLKFT
jgi:hypothetical protein